MARSDVRILPKSAKSIALDSSLQTCATMSDFSRRERGVMNGSKFVDTEMRLLPIVPPGCIIRVQEVVGCRRAKAWHGVAVR